MGQGPFDPGSFNFEGPLVHGPLGLGPFGFGPLVQGPLALYHEYRPFWAQALNGMVRFGTGHIIGQNVIMQWQDPSPMIPNYVGFMTGWGSSGDWKWNIQDLGLYVQKF